MRIWVTLPRQTTSKNDPLTGIRVGYSGEDQIPGSFIVRANPRDCIILDIRVKP